MKIMHVVNRVLVLVAHGFLTACATVSVVPKTEAEVDRTSAGNVVATEITSASAIRYEVTPGVKYKSPKSYASNSLPAYPPQLLASNLPPVTVLVRIIVNEDGQVIDVVNLDNTKGAHEEFFLATKSTLQAWQYVPLFRVTGVENEPIPFHLDFSFTFTQIDGNPVIKVN